MSVMGNRLVAWALAALVTAAGVLAATPAHAQEAGSISGVVTDAAGEPAPQIHVAAYRHHSSWDSWMWHSSTTTDTDGSYSLAGLPDGDYRVEFETNPSSPNLVSEWWEDEADLQSATTLTVSGGAAIVGISPSLNAGAAITGVVTQEGGAPASGIPVRAYSAATGHMVSFTMSDDAGAYRLTGLPAGDHLVEFAPLGTSLAGEWWDDAPSRSGAAAVSVAAEAEVSGIDAVLAAAGSMTGVVTDGTGAAAPHVYVSVYRASADGVGEWVGSASTDAFGEYTVTGLAPGDYKVQFSASGALLGEWYADAADAASAAAVSVTAGASTTVHAQLTIGATITGVVTDEAGEPVENVSVWARPATAGGAAATGVSTLSDGSYTLTGLAPGSYTVQFETGQAGVSVAGEWWDDAKTQATATVLTVAAGDVIADVSPRLAAGAEIAGVVRDGNGAGLEGVHVGVLDAAGQWLQNVWTAADGSYVVRGLDAGVYRLSFAQDVEAGALIEWWNNAPDLASADDIVVASGETAAGIDVTMSVDDGSVLETYSASLSGVVTDASGSPLEGVAVSVDGGYWGDGIPTDASGAWSMRSMPAGSYRVSFTAEIDGVLVTQWWDGASDRDSATVIPLLNAEQRTGIDAVFGAAPLPLLDSSTPKITGPLRVGATVKAHPREWTAGTQFAFQWFADGEPIANATAAQLTVTPDLAGARLTVVVTGFLEGYQSVTETSAASAPVSQRR